MGGSSKKSGANLNYYNSKFIQTGLVDHFQRIEKAKKEKEEKELRI